MTARGEQGRQRGLSHSYHDHVWHEFTFSRLKTCTLHRRYHCDLTVAVMVFARMRDMLRRPMPANFVILDRMTNDLSSGVQYVESTECTLHIDAYF
jgi:hypothetical protein